MSRGELKAIYDLLYACHTNFDQMMHYLWDTTSWKVCDLDLTFKGHKVNWRIIYDFEYVLHTNIGHSMHRFWDIGLNR